MPKIRPAEAGAVATVAVRVPETLYRQLRELALRHDVTLGQAFDLLFDKIKLEAQDQIDAVRAELNKLKKECERWQKKYKADTEALQAELKKVKQDRDKWKKKYAEEIKEAERVLGRRARQKAK